MSKLSLQSIMKDVLFLVTFEPIQVSHKSRRDGGELWVDSLQGGNCLAEDGER